jgi:multicomponent Na+:H+ antiporter subunit E
MNVLFINLLLALIWAFLKGQITASTLIEGFIVGYLVLWLTSPIYGTSSYFKKFLQVILFFAFFFKELVVATGRVAYLVVKPDLNMNPGIIAVPLDLKTDVEIAMLANLITLTPGTLTLDVSDDRRVIYVHVMHVNNADSFRREIKEGFEKRVGELLG